MNKSFQRIDSLSNSHIGLDFEMKAQLFFKDQGIILYRDYKVMVGIGTEKKPHRFDLGCSEQKILVECKSHRWTESNKVPSAKITIWNEAMYYFHTVPVDYRKIMFVLKDMRNKIGETLAEYYIRRYSHLIPTGVEIWEYDDVTALAEKVF